MRWRRRIVLTGGFVAFTAGWLCAADQQRGAPPPTTGTAFLAGQVVDATTNAPITGVTVTLIGSMAGRAGGPQPPVVVDSQGRFFFANLPAGSYRTQVVKTGYSVTSLTTFSRSLDLADGERVTNVKVSLVKLSTITGVVRDDGGDPAVGVDVIAFERATVRGRPTLQSYTQSKTDDRGMYRLSGLRPREYFICACGKDPMPFDGLLLTTLAADPIQLMGAAARALRVGSDAVTLDSTLRTIAPTFYPNSPTISRATRVAVAAGEEKTGVDIDVAVVRAARVSGTVVGSPSPVVAPALRLVPAGENTEGGAITQMSPVLMQPDGRFDFAGVAPGQYVLRAMTLVNAARGGGPTGSALAVFGARGAAMASANIGVPAPNEPVLWASQPITVGEDGVTGLVISLRPGTPISGRMQFAGAAQPPPPQSGRALVVVRTTNTDPFSSPSGTIATVTSDFTFRIPGIEPGRYGITPSNWPAFPTFKSVTVGGVDVTDLPIEIAETEVSDVVVTMSDLPRGTVSGAVDRAPGAGDQVIVVFPTDRRYWVDLVAAQRRFVVAPVNAKGQFKFGSPPAGEYFYGLLPDSATEDWPTVAGLEALSRSAPRFTIADGQSLTLTVR